MKKFVMPAMFALAVSAGPALAADMVKPVYKAAPPVVVTPWDVAIGAALMTDYNFRGISQSDRKAAVNGYFEARFNPTKDVQWYAGVAGNSVKLATDPSAEIDLYGGVRLTFGQWAIDLGGMYYLYPGERALDTPIVPPNGNTTLADTDFWEVYAKTTYTFNDNWAVGANIFYAPDWLATGATGTYGALTLKYTATALPSGWGWYVSGEIGKYWLGTTDLLTTPTGLAVYANAAGALVNADLPDYAYWNVGLGFTYKAITIDLRYHDTDLSKTECNALTADPGASITAVTAINNFVTGAESKWCGSAFIGKLSFDTTLNALK